MKKSLVCMSALALLSLGALGYAHLQISESAHHFSFTEYPLVGDLSAAEGVSLELRAELDRRLFWDVSVVPGQEGQAEFRFTPARAPSPQNRSYGNLEMHAASSVSASTSGSFEDEWDNWFLPEVLKELAEQTAPGETREITIPLAEYTDYYPLEVSLDTPAVTMFWNPEELYRQAFLPQLADAFRFPVLEGHQHTFSVTRNSAGALDELSYSPANRSGASIFSNSFYSEEYVYFVVEARSDADDHLLDYSGTPNGYGIYALPMNKKGLTLDDLEFVYPLDPEARPFCMTYSQEEGELLYITDDNGLELLHRIDAATWQEEQVLPICDASETDYGIHALVPKGNLLLAFQGEEGAHLLQKDGSGDYVYRFPLHFPDEIAYRDLSRRQLDFFYDGDRLVLLAPVRDVKGDFPFSYYYNTSYALYVFGAEGTRYAGFFASAMDAGRDDTDSSRYSCRLADEDALTLIQPKGGTDHA